MGPEPAQGVPSYGTPITLQDVQGLLNAVDTRNQTRHEEVLTRFDATDGRITALEARIRTREIEAAENRPIIKGSKGVAILLAGALISGFIGSLFTF